MGVDDIIRRIEATLHETENMPGVTPRNLRRLFLERLTSGGTDSARADIGHQLDITEPRTARSDVPLVPRHRVRRRRSQFNTYPRTGVK